MAQMGIQPAQAEPAPVPQSTGPAAAVQKKGGMARRIVTAVLIALATFAYLLWSGWSTLGEAAKPAAAEDWSSDVGGEANPAPATEDWSSDLGGDTAPAQAAPAEGGAAAKEAAPAAKAETAPSAAGQIAKTIGLWLLIAIGAGVIATTIIELLRNLVQNKRTAPYVFVSPFFIIFFTFGLFPILFSAYLSFQSWDPATGLGGMKGVGTSNYLFTLSDKVFWLSLKNTFWIALASGVPQHVVGMPLAYFFQVAYKKSRNLITGIYFLPFITSSVAVSLIFSSLFSKDFGVINATLDSLARLPVVGQIFPQSHIEWLTKAPYTKPAVSFVIWWRYVGWNTVLYLSALQAISNDLFEAAEMDGASRWQTFRHVVLPLLAPMMFFAITLTIIGNLQMFDVPYIILGPNGGVEFSGLTTTMYLYQSGFNYGDFGTACAISWLLFLVIATLTWANQRLLGRKSAEGMA